MEGFTLENGMGFDKGAKQKRVIFLFLTSILHFAEKIALLRLRDESASSEA